MYNNTHTGESAKKDVKIRENNNTLGEKLYNLLDGNEGDLKTYLEYRFTALWDNYDHLTKRSDLLSGTEEATVTLTDEQKSLLSEEKTSLIQEQQEKLTQKKELTVYSLTMFQQLLKNLREEEGTSRDDDEKEFNEMLKFVRDALHSLENHTPSEEEIQDKIITPLKAKWKSFQKNNIKTFA
ncbi:MAG: hypothetical protein LBG59_01670 [Candidatus Peribacteria bacterium]|nr:hypothetical protein [Candidatus Peribacteria bacterium]